MMGTDVDIEPRAAERDRDSCRVCGCYLLWFERHMAERMSVRPGSAKYSSNSSTSNLERQRRLCLTGKGCWKIRNIVQAEPATMSLSRDSRTSQHLASISISVCRQLTCSDILLASVVEVERTWVNPVHSLDLSAVNIAPGLERSGS